MKLNNTWHYLALVAMLGMGACSSSRQAAQNAGEVDDLYGNSGDAAVYAGDDRKTTQQDVRQASRLDRRQLQQRGSNLNPDYIDSQKGATGTDSEYYTELSARQVQRGISPDPGWGSTGNYNDGFVNGYNQGLYGANSWNRWGLANAGMLGGFSLGFGIGSAFGYSPFGYNSFYSPYSSYAYSPFGFGGGFYDPFYSSYGYGGFGGYGYSPFGYGGGYGYNPYAFGGGYYGNRPTIVNNNYIVTGADPYRNNRTYGPRGSSSSARYNGDFDNTAPSNNGGRRSGSYGSSYSNTTTGDGTYYSNPNSGRGSSRGAGSYSNSSTPNGGRTYGNSSGSYSPSTGAASSGSYYERPSRQGSYSPQTGSSGSGSSRGGSYSQQSQPSYQQQSQPSYNNSRSYTSPTPSYSSPTPSYSSPSPSYSAPSSSGSSSSGSSGGGYSSGSGSSRGPR